MKKYLITTGTLFGLMALLHVWKAIAEWPSQGVSLGFLVEMTIVVVLPGVLSWWAWRLLGKSSAATIQPDTKPNH